MKRITWILVILALFILFLIRPIRTIGVMEDIARDELVTEVSDRFGDTHYEAVLEQFKGPEIIENKQEGYVEFKWYTKVANGDTAYIYIDVFKSPLAKYFITPRVTMNHQWQMVTPK